MLSLPSKIKGAIQDGGLTVDILPIHREINGFLLENHIAINKDISWYQQRFTVCHELAHHYLGHTHNCDGKLQEKEADDFAISLLVSDDELIEELEKYEGDTTMLEKVFGIPKEILQKRILEIYS